ncbi:hypothetical protein WJX72_001439 [[Myrmecia] bisecta]|uniref:Uncharacterized protein n=1 Tax=[Myrmecia] bisecta TaxID=41462 RepID=A0AAW1QP50_9CHLO
MATSAFVGTQLPTRPAVRSTCAARAASLRQRTRVVTTAQAEDRKASPGQAVFAAVAAGLLSFSGPAVADILPNSATSESARNQVNQRLDNVPSIKDVGKSITNRLDVGSARDVGKAVDRNTPDVDLTQNPRDLAKQGARAVERNTPDAGGLLNKVKGAVKQNAPGLNSGDAKSAVKDAARKVDRKTNSASGELKSQVGSIKGNAKNLAQKAKTAVKQKNGTVTKEAKDVAQEVGRKSGAPNLPTPGNKGTSDLTGQVGSARVDEKSLITKAKDAVKLNQSGTIGGSDLKSAAKDSARKLDRNTPDLPSAGAAGDKIKSQVGSIKGDVKGAANDLPSASRVGDKAAAAVDSASGDAKGILNKAKNAIRQNTPGAIGGSDLKSAAKDSARKLDRNTPDLPSAGAAGDKIKSQVGSIKGDVKGAANDLPSASRVGDKAAAAVDSASGDAKGILNKAKNAIRQNTPGAIGAEDVKGAAKDAARQVDGNNDEFLSKASQLSEKAVNNVSEGTQGVLGRTNVLDVLENSVGAAKDQVQGAVQNGKQAVKQAASSAGL